jgi:hypothetical protein
MIERMQYRTRIDISNNFSLLFLGMQKLNLFTLSLSIETCTEIYSSFANIASARFISKKSEEA